MLKLAVRQAGIFLRLKKLISLNINSKKEQILMDQNAGDDPDKSNNFIRPYNTKELAALYKVSPYTIRKWLKPCANKIGKRNGYTYTVLQVKTILEFLGQPVSSE